ncbi:cysteine synthase A [candidate division GN15 bacterium]|nr:cysteine synthase A [candidate division GN15 bacterium]
MRFNNVIEAIGRTPLIRLNRLTGPDDATVYAKMEAFNPGGSVKDRIGAAMIEAAEREGKLKPGMTIVEPTSGNTGIALAMAAASKGYTCILTMPESMSQERRALLNLFGAKLVLTPADKGMKGAIEKAAELAKADDCYQPFQFANPANPAIHRDTTAPEIIEDLAEVTLDAYVAGVGTGGTISGSGRVLKDRYGCTLVAVEPDASPVISGGEPGPHPLQGIGAGFVPDNYHGDIVDRVMRVKNEDAMRTARDLAAKEGLLAGISSGAIVWAALQVAKELGKGKTVVTFVCDTGERYVSTPLFTELPSE